LLTGGSTFTVASDFVGLSLPAGFFSGSLQLKNKTGNSAANKIFFIALL
jgi:hypothetical protein